jgi:hypothetical protein
VKVTFVPAQIVVAVAETETEGVTGEVTVIVTPFEVAVDGLGHVADEVITTVTTSLFTNVALWNVGLFVPALFPFTFH